MPNDPNEAAEVADRTYPKTARATIKFENGKVVIENQDGSGEKIRVQKGGVVHWDCPAGDGLKWWAIMMKDATPFEGNKEWAAGNRGRPATTKIRNDADEKSYFYSVVGSDGTDIDFRDPELEIGPI